MSKKNLLIILIAISALPQLCEQIYATTLANLAKNFSVLEGEAGWTVSSFLIGFALGMFFWGNQADGLGRRPSVLIGMSMYLLGSIFCLFSTSLAQLLISRFIQGFGGSTSSIIVQTMARDSFQSHERGKAFSLVSFCHSSLPAIGPPVAGYFCEWIGWPFVFLIALVLGGPIIGISYRYLPETLNSASKTPQSVIDSWVSFFKNKKCFFISLIIGVSNGLLYSYYAKCSFYFTQFLNLAPHQFGYFGFLTAGGSMLGAAISHLLNKRKVNQSFIILIGCSLMFFGAALLTLSRFVDGSSILFFGSFSLILSMMGFNMAIPNCLSLALEDFRDLLGRIGAVLGFFYYSVIAVITFFISFIQQKSGIELPLILISLSSLNLVFYYFGFKSQDAKVSLSE